MDLESIQDRLEKRLMNPPKTATASNPYLAGYIDAMYDKGHINNTDRATLFFQYANPGEAKRLREIFDKE